MQHLNGIFETIFMGSFSIREHPTSKISTYEAALVRRDVLDIPGRGV